jgi:stearoyl-CoA desaturase (delta-9 desaturase)
LRWYDIDPTKWLIYLGSLVGLTSDLHTFDAHVIQQAETIAALDRARKAVLLLETKLCKQNDQARGTAVFTPDHSDLDTMSFADFKLYAESIQVLHGGKACVFTIHGTVYNATEFVQQHIGGPRLLLSQHGRDATTAFYTGLNHHSQAAKLLLERYAVAVIGH